MIFLSIGIESDCMSDDDILNSFIAELGKISENTNMRFLQIKTNLFYKSYLLQKAMNDCGLFFQIPCTFRKKDCELLLPRFYVYTFAKIGASYVYICTNNNIFTFHLQHQYKQVYNTDLSISITRNKVSLYVKKHIVMMLKELCCDDFIYLRMTDNEIYISAMQPPHYVPESKWRFLR